MGCGASSDSKPSVLTAAVPSPSAAAAAPPLTTSGQIVINGDTVPCKGEAGVDVAACLAANMFKDWAASVRFLWVAFTLRISRISR